jgi:dolichyl-phosphate beta-glucosyltransferase
MALSTVFEEEGVLGYTARSLEPLEESRRETALKSLSIVIPAYNEAARLPVTLSAVRAYLEAGDFEFSEIVVVDDGSTDATRQVADQFASEHCGVRLLRNPGNRGKGFSVRHGVQEARGDWVLFSDADLSAPIEELDRLVAGARRAGACVAIASRALNRNLIGVHQSLLRENAGRVFNRLMRLLIGLPYRDTQCGFKLFEARAAREIFRRQQLERFGFDVEVLFIARLLGYAAVEVPVRWDHCAGTKVSMFGDSLNMFLDLLRIRWYQRSGKYR